MTGFKLMLGFEQAFEININGEIKSLSRNDEIVCNVETETDLPYWSSK